jgi:T3SS (YopN, CesT) and YbjN peptide-binding chaperone 2
MQWTDHSVLEAASWRLASELVRRHPSTLRLIRAHPGGGQSDVLWLLPSSGEVGDVRLNRAGSISVLSRFDGREETWPSTS